jgi:hypothetical protein
VPFKQLFRDLINQQLRREPQFRKQAFGALDLLLQGEGPWLLCKYDDGNRLKLPLMDIYCQTAQLVSVCLEDLVITAFAWQKILQGEIIYDFIQVREPPYPDKEADKNRAILHDMVASYQQRGLYHLKEADFWGGTQGSDGYVEFDRPFINDFRGGSCDEMRREINPASPVIRGECKRFPLEVGYCLPNQMLTHLAESRCVARFPYGYNVIIFLEAVKRCKPDGDS